GPREPTGPYGVRRRDRSSVASSATESAMPSARLWLRLSPGRDVSTARSAVAPRRPPRSSNVVGGAAGDPRTRAGLVLPDRALRPLAAGGAAVLPQPRRDLEGQRATECRPVRPTLQRVVTHRR